MKEHVLPPVITAAMTFDQDQLIRSLGQYHKWERARLLVEYVAAVLAYSPNNGRAFAEHISQRMNRVGGNQFCGPVVGCCALAVLFSGPKDTDAFSMSYEIAATHGLINGPLGTKEELATFCATLFFRGDELVQEAIPFLLKLFTRIGYLMVPKERDLFVKCLQGLPDDKITECIETFCGALISYDFWDRSAGAALKVALLVRAWPGRRADIIARCDPSVVRTFPTSGDPWKEVHSALSLNPT
jgi:hypothetical protein